MSNTIKFPPGVQLNHLGLPAEVGKKRRGAEADALAHPRPLALDWEPAYSNSRLNVHNCTPDSPIVVFSSPQSTSPYSLQLDRLSFVADTTLHKNRDGELTSPQWDRFCNHPDVIGRHSAKYPYRYQLKMASGYVVQFSDRTASLPEVRVDLNPAKLRGAEQSLSLLCSFLRNPRITRMDFAIDYCYDLSDWFIQSKSRLSSRCYHSASGRLETKYLGGPNSNLQIRVYDKALEQKQPGTLWRVEAQVRLPANVTADMLEPFKDLRIWKPAEGLSIQEASMLYYLMDHPGEWSRLNPRTRRKLKAIADCEDLSIHLTPTPQQIYHSEIRRLQSKLSPFFRTMLFGDETLAKCEGIQ